MKHTDPSLNSVSGPGWQLLGELELAVDPGADRTVSKWLTVILSPLNLHEEFMSKVLRSAEAAAARAMQTETVIKFQHTHLLIFIPAERPSNGQTWGFFRIEKIETPTDEESTQDHAIEFYLYLEG
ncbi:MAG TPA: hypothetical protein VI524_08795 [Anaerolineales bacterium]|nr:hypothetical protein [Anaerolineales bacterium]